jgi:signal transduction histidine kinase
MGMVSGSISTLTSSRGAHIIFLATPIPYGVRLLQMGDSLHLAMAGMLVVYVAMMARIGFRLYTSITESLRLRFENLDLLEELRKSHSELEQHVEDRTAELKRSEEALRFADRRKDEFLAMLGHELRNPLAPIRNALEVMNKPAAPESTVKWAREVIDRQTERLTRLVNDLLDVSRIMYGKISLQEETIEIATVVRHRWKAVFQ